MHFKWEKWWQMHPNVRVSSQKWGVNPSKFGELTITIWDLDGYLWYKIEMNWTWSPQPERCSMSKICCAGANRFRPEPWKCHPLRTICCTVNLSPTVVSMGSNASPPVNSRERSTSSDTEQWEGFDLPSLRDWGVSRNNPWGSDLQPQGFDLRCIF